MVKNVRTIKRDGLIGKYGELADGTHVTFCHPCRRWEWDCVCGHGNSSRDIFCTNCDRSRQEGAENRHED